MGKLSILVQGANQVRAVPFWDKSKSDQYCTLNLLRSGTTDLHDLPSRAERVRPGD